MIRYFPFSPGIGWSLKHGKYLEPKINLDVWRRVIGDNKITVVAFGGLLESFFSLTYLEILNFLAPQNFLAWTGNTALAPLIKMNNLAKIEEKCSADQVKQYPVPIFIDLQKQVYWNCLNNYQIVKPYYGGTGYQDTSPIVTQLLRNILVPWQIQFLPKLRNTDISPRFKKWINNTKFDFKKPYFCILDKLGTSEHSIDTLEWSEIQIKSLAAMLGHRGIKTIWITRRQTIFNFSEHLIQLSFLELNDILYCLRSTIGVLSEEVDFLFLSMVLSSNSFIFMKKQKSKIWNLAVNAKKIEIDRGNLITKDILTPLDVFQYLKY